MLLKLLGGILVIVSSGLIGVAIASRFSNRPSEIRKIRVLFQMLETEIIYGSTPLPAAFKNLSAKADAIWSKFFNLLSEGLLSGKFYSLSEAWNSSIKNALGDTSLSSVDIELLKSFGNVLGCSDREDQQKHFKLFYAQLAHHEDIAEQDRKRNEKMYRSLGFLFGILVFVILV